MELFRDQASILVIFFNTHEPVSGVSLADYVNSSLKTLKKIIDDLNVICLQNGCEIKSKTGVGYEIEVKNWTRYAAFREKITRKFHLNLYYINADKEKIHYIIRRFLVAKNRYIQKLAEDCNCSESTIRRDMPQVKSRLQRYSLTLSNNTNKGMILDGTEWNIRMALLNEYFIYSNFEKVYFTGKETSFESMFTGNGINKAELQKSLSSILTSNEYTVAHSALSEIINLIVLTIERQKYKNLLQPDQRFENYQLESEKQIIKQIFSSSSVLSSYPLSDNELIYLAAFIKAQRVINYHDFLQLPERETAEKVVAGFFEEFGRRFDLSRYNLSVLNKDLCCEITRMYFRSMVNVHIKKNYVDQFLIDGSCTLDLCSLMYLYLQKVKEIDCNIVDAAYLYYSFAYFNTERSRAYQKRTLVVSELGYFTARSIANQFSSVGGSNDIEYVPAEYLKLKGMDLSSICGIVTDIDSIRDEFPTTKVVDIHFMRDPNEAKQITAEFFFPIAEFRTQVFTPDDIYYHDHFDSLKEIKEYIKTELLNPDEDGDRYIKAIAENLNVYGGIRKNNIYLVSAINDVIGRSFIKIIYLKESIELQQQYLNKIVIYNAAGNSYHEKGRISGKVVNLLHLHSLIFTGDRQKDYEMLCNVMYGR